MIDCNTYTHENVVTEASHDHGIRVTEGDSWSQKCDDSDDEGVDVEVCIYRGRCRRWFRCIWGVLMQMWC